MGRGGRRREGFFYNFQIRQIEKDFLQAAQKGGGISPVIKPTEIFDFFIPEWGGGGGEAICSFKIWQNLGQCLHSAKSNHFLNKRITVPLSFYVTVNSTYLPS
jgi:hypothetical protein